ncbi:hypothetical protein EYZ11_012356 [Aspergillus tanneri]|uniref:Uncharacterized protein n=1 Tax=Aspergillus tanneri TaxID=1220188 RepID=A0A4S3J0G8_9EURO|nr:hypothetical protein EYZ11_012356 [Aspergillus tanneri]
MVLNHLCTAIHRGSNPTHHGSSTLVHTISDFLKLVILLR